MLHEFTYLLHFFVLLASRFVNATAGTHVRPEPFGLKPTMSFGTLLTVKDSSRVIAKRERARSFSIQPKLLRHHRGLVEIAFLAKVAKAFGKL